MLFSPCRGDGGFEKVAGKKARKLRVVPGRVENDRVQPAGESPQQRDE